MSVNTILDLLKTQESQILMHWLQVQIKAYTARLDLISNKDLEQQSKEFLKLFTQAIQTSDLTDINQPEFDLIRQFLAGISNSRVLQGFTPSETATFVFSLKEPLFNNIHQLDGVDNKALQEEMWKIMLLIDQLGLFTFEQFQKTREDVISRQQKEMMELSTPVVKLWEGILILPLIGTLDSARTQQVMENLLQKIVDTSSEVAIIDITGIPLVDTLVAQHLIKTISAARLMGTECILSGIRPQIAQTIVHLGISLQQITTKATLADAVTAAIQKAGFTISRHKLA